MTAHDTTLVVLLGAAVVTSIIELGLSAYVVHVFSQTVETYDPIIGFTYVKLTPPGEVSFLLFCSLWSLIVSVALLVAAIVLKRNFSHGGNKTLPIGVLIVETVTLIFWLAGFAALSAIYGGEPATGVLGALLAFAVISWLIYLAITVLAFLTAFGVMRSEHRGREPIFKRSGTTMGNNSTMMPEIQHRSPAATNQETLPKPTF